METISQIGAAESPFEGVEWGITNPTPLQSKKNTCLGFREELTEEQSNFESTKKISKLELKPTFHQTTNSHPNPVSDRQITREIVELHMQTGYYPSFDKDDALRSQFTNEYMHY